METVLSLKNKKDDFEVIYDVLPSVELDDRQREIMKKVQQVDERISSNQKKIDEINSDIDRLTNNADGLDYTVAVGSGVLTGIIDSLWVGEFSMERGKAWSNKKVNEFVMKIAKSQGYDGERLDGAIRHLEDNFKIPSDNVWKGEGVGISAKSHHLDDLAHHPTPLGLLCSILTQFTETGYFQNKDGDFIPIEIVDGKWIGKDVPSKLFAGTINWFFHLVSDMSGSNKTAGVGMGIPGPVVSMLKELSLIPGLNQTGLAKKMKEVFVDYKFDLRSELAVAHELGRQAFPVLLNEVLVRVFYFVRRVIVELKEKKSLKKVEWKKTLPWRNRTITRMLTIATGTFTAIDLADAAIRSVVKSGGAAPAFLTNFVLRVNFVGFGRFAIAIGSDVGMECKRNKQKKERMRLIGEQLHLTNTKVYYKQAEMWIAAESAHTTIEEAYSMIEETTAFFVESMEEINANVKNIGRYRGGIKENNSGLLEEMEDILDWG
ncbi:hypothetical protein ACFOZ1_02300 [Gracilibacillus marinus]|uniref:Uncharacterized protein n=1 Tax=Gracilibacillus marinus TaxID=630535 RepID=A0ABV8VQ85_9BACI